jgi:hypothetical protein
MKKIDIWCTFNNKDPYIIIGGEIVNITLILFENNWHYWIII